MAAARAPFNVTDKISPEAEAAERSPWHSPVPYLFGGLAAMLGLIAFALLILACSYWKLSGYLENGEGERDLEAGEGKQSETEKVNQSAMEPKFLVIMAGQAKPTFLATPVSSSSSRSSSFGSNSEKSSGGEENEKPGKAESHVCVCGESNNPMRSGSTAASESSEQSRREER